MCASARVLFSITISTQNKILSFKQMMQLKLIKTLLPCSLFSSKVLPVPHLFLFQSQGLHKQVVVPCCCGASLVMCFVCGAMGQVARATH